MKSTHPALSVVLRLIVFCGAAALLLVASACHSPTGAIPAHLSTGRTSAVLAPGDLLRFAFPGDPTLNQSERIRANGKITLAYVGEITAAGKTVGQLEEQLSAGYKSHLANPEVVVWVETSNQFVSVTGAVNKPGEIPLDRPLTLFEAIQKAGGFSNIANDHNVLVVRTANNRHYTQTFDLSGLRKGREIPVFYLRPYDSVRVAERFF